jgi:divalent metal cation (Fe/Co/Zn/Cd) transporter
MPPTSQSRATVILALAANITVAVAKLVGGLLTGSAAMLSEAAHSIADTINELFLLTSLRRSDRPADARHPFGYGMERFFWSLLAAVGRIRASTDPSVTTVASEDTAALVGLFLAGGGLALHQVTRSAWWEGASAALIAVLLVIVAGALGRDSKSLLIGEAASPQLTDALRDYLDACPAIDQVVELLTMHIGANQVLLAVRVDLADGLASADVERVSTQIDTDIQRRWPVVTEVFIDATRAVLT